MTEASIVKALAAAEYPATLIAMLAKHAKWSLRREIQLGILRRPETPEAIVVKIARTLSRPAILQLIKELRLPKRKAELERLLLDK